jgi:hypothetical protein
VFVERLINCSNDRKLGVTHAKGVRKTNSERLLHIKCQSDTSLAAKHYIATGKKPIQVGLQLVYLPIEK